MADPRVEDPGWGDAGGRDLVFVSYSHADAVWAQRFQVMLTPLARAQRLRLWIDTDRLQVGEVWRGEIAAAIARSRVALLLVSQHFLASAFINDHELPALVEHGVRLAPVLVGDCLWQHDRRLEPLQWLHHQPPLNLLKGGRQDRQLRLVSEGLLQVVTDLAASEPGPTPPSAWAGVGRGSVEITQVPRGQQPGRLVGVPEPPPGYVARDELAGLIAAVTDTTGPGGGVVGVTGVVSPLGLHGQGGIGKTVLAAALARDADIRSRFPDGVFWVTLGEHADLLAAQLDLLDRLDAGGPVPSTVAEATDRLRGVLAARRVLLVVDDVWTGAAAAALRVTGPRGRLVYTSRDPGVIDAVAARPYRVDVLSPAAARGLAAAVLDQPAAALPVVADGVLDRVGRVALAVALLAAAVRGGTRTWQDIDADLDGGEAVFGQHPYANAFKAMQIATTTLPDQLYQALLGLAVFPPDTRIPVAAIARYWAHTRNPTGVRAPADTARDLQRLAAAGVLQHQDGHIGFHDLQYDYLLLHAPPPGELHAALVDAYRAVLPATSPTGTSGDGAAGTRWWRLPPDEPYIGDHLAGHLRGAGLHEELRATVTDPAFLARRVDTASVYAAEADLAQAGALYPADGAVAWWRGWLARHAHLLVPVRAARSKADGLGRGAGAVGDVVVTFVVWMRADPAWKGHGVDSARLDPLLPRPSLHLRWGLTPPVTALIRVLTGHTGSVWAVGWSPDGSRLVSGGDDGTVRVWEAGSGRLVHTLTGHTGGVRAVAWSPERDPAGQRRRRRHGAGVGGGVGSAGAHPDRAHRLGVGGGVVPGRDSAGQQRRRPDGAGVGGGVGAAGAHPHRALQRGAGGGVVAGRFPAGQRRQRRHGAGVGGGVGAAGAHPDRAHRPGAGGGVVAGRDPAGQRRRRRHGAGVGGGVGAAGAHPDRAHRRGAGGGVVAGRFPAGQRRRRRHGAGVGGGVGSAGAHPDRAHRRGVGGGVVAGRDPAGQRRRWHHPPLASDSPAPRHHRRPGSRSSVGGGVVAGRDPAGQRRRRRHGAGVGGGVGSAGTHPDRTGNRRPCPAPVPHAKRPHRTGVGGGVVAGWFPAGQRRQRRQGAGVGGGVGSAGAHPHRALQRGAGGGVVAGRDPAGQRRRQRQGAGVEGGVGSAGAHPDRVHRRDVGGGVVAGRDPAGQRRRGPQGAGVGGGVGSAGTHPDRAHRRGAGGGVVAGRRPAGQRRRGPQGAGVGGGSVGWCTP